MSSSSSTRKKVQKKCKIRGYSLKVDALDEILSFVSRFNESDDESINLLLDRFHDQPFKSSIIDKEAIHSVVSLLLEAEATVGESSCSASAATSSRSFYVIDAFLVPKLCYDPIKKIFYEYAEILPIHGDVSAKSTLYRDRFLLLSQRLSRAHHFS